MHRAPWPDAAPLREAAGDDADPAVLTAVGRGLAGVRKAKSVAKVGDAHRGGLGDGRGAAPAPTRLVAARRADLAAAGRVAELR